MIFLAGMVLRPDSSFGQPSWKTKLAYRLAESIQAIQNFCIERAQVECEILELEHNPPYLRKGQSIDYIGVRKREVTYFYLVVTEADEMAPDIYLFDSRGKLLSTGLVLKDAALAVHRPEYTQKVIQRIRMSRGSGHIGFAVLAPVGD
ncbi:MAG: hypothetical protein N3G78_01390 [Desulfobacterota bacterium]|nr:hypothetical protein [Thermodesulfobacteriota bacterium]